ncbi:MAG: Two-component response regulator family protein [uncultured Sulfurovum sp.]|uniref:Two-component response regulator family protein n=1 Tax=uncultured Sulfurovum sp. TaxID=269237 RepID=A0A6S6STP6_9BACT|nr:MAG: Two-component response regulator family protein [uncultured Sulfurovum sp.]
MINKKYQFLKTKIILYVEDDLELQKNISLILNNFFDKILIASDGDEAYDIYLENQNIIDIMITDINMPNTDGIQLCKHIRAYQKELPIVILSAYTNTDYLLESIDLNILTYVTKPFTTQKILRLLDKFLEFFELNNQKELGKNIKLTCDNSLLTINDRTIKLTKKEKIFLKLLSENQTVTYDMMYEYMWDYEKSPSVDAVKSFIRKLKSKLPIELFKNQKGEGYYLL